ncbi:MAG: type II secretion system protein J [Ilumatobacter sp.]|uniref:PulJ/GspJ family protein n=1 Tax=Ilumatobacter sp. TaxID=1967498 RepID=UPI00391A47C8
MRLQTKQTKQTEQTEQTEYASSQHAASSGARRDGGFTLPELLIVVVLSGTLMAVIASAISVMLRVTPQAEARLAESKDITFLQTWIPIDLATAINSYDDPVDADVKAKLAANPPNISYNSTLPGGNVLTLVVPNGATGELEIIVYRYVDGGNDNWQLVRYRISDPGCTGVATAHCEDGEIESSSPVGVAHELPSPPAGWVPGDPVDFAFQVIARNQAALRPVGEDVTVFFDSGNTFRTGGAGLSAEQDLTPNDPVTLPDPTAPPSRCGGRIALVIDTSGSVPINHGGIPTEQAAVGFIDAFVGTPTEFSINGFDREGYGMVPDTGATGVARYSLNGQRAPFVSVLENTAEVQQMRDRITALDDLDGAWPGGGAAITARDPNGDRIMWDQIGSGTNWEDGIYSVFFDGATGQPYNSFQPDLVVFITDGQPSLVRNADGTPGGANGRTATDRAAAVANAGRSQGARVIGVMVGNAANNATYRGYLQDVVGGTVWNGSVAPDGTINVGNAVAADFFSGAFADLGGVLRSIMIAECGGTVTVRKSIDGAPGTNTGRWNYSTETGDQVLDTGAASSITFDFSFEGNQIVREVLIREEARAGYSFVRGDCQVGGVPVPESDIVQSPDGTPGVAIQLSPDEAVSCVMVSTPES